MFEEIVDRIVFLAQNGKEYERKFVRCQGYRPDSIIKWKRQCGLKWTTTFKILDGLEVFDSAKIRSVINEVVGKNKALFAQENLFIASFGSEGKSGGMICYEFRHASLVSATSFKNSSEIVSLPPNSTIIFVDDLIGTGTQSLDYINEKLNLLLSPSHNAILLTICATPEGINKIVDNSNFRVLVGITLEENLYQHYSETSIHFSAAEKILLKRINSRLKNPAKFDYDRGLLIAFYYSVPNNTMPIIWKEGCEYVAENGKTQKWFALLPRKIPVT